MTEDRITTEELAGIGSEPKASDERNGCFLDSMWCCKVCDGEIPDGHTDYCYIWKLEKKHRDFIANEYDAVLKERDDALRELAARRAAETLPEGDFLDAQFRDICPNCSLTGFYRGVFDAGVRAGRAAETDMVLAGAAIDLEDRLGKTLDELGLSIERNAQLETRFRELAELYTAATGRKVPVDAALSARPTT